MIDVARLPAEIRDSTRALVWRDELRGCRRTKVPYQAWDPARRAAVDQPTTWAPFALAVAVLRAGQADGVGIVLGDGLAGVDLDEARDPRTGRMAPWAFAIVQELDSYTEVSPSGTGLHILAHGTLPAGGRRRGDVEMYDGGRYFTVTGAHVRGTGKTIAKRTAALAALHARLFPPRDGGPHAPHRATPDRDDAALLARAHAARNGAKFAELWRGNTAGYASPSEADLALANQLAYWSDGDARRMDALFRRSGLMRRKWDERRGAATYGERTIARALEGRTA